MLKFASKYVVEAESEDESLSEEDLCYSDEEYSASDDEVDDKEAELERKTLAAKKEKVRKADTNVVCISLETLAQQAELLTGDPVFCGNCGVLFNQLSKTQGKDDEQKWICEFCSHENAVQIEEEEYPKVDSGDYILEVPSQQEKEASKAGMIIFCIDISGSMCVTTEVVGQHKLKGAEKLDKLKSLNEDRSNQYLPKQNKNATWVSRLQCVQAAVEAYMTKLISENPDTLVGVVTFNNDVTIIGDGTTAPVTVTGDKLSQFDSLLDIGRQCAIRRSIKESHDGLSKHLFALEETGATALGPALLVSLGIASSHVGAQVIICTDGLANVGLGAQDELKNEEQERAVSVFYENLGSLAAQKGTSVSIISIKGTEAKMENLGKLADGSGGQVNIVDPLSLHKEFASILSEPIVATNVAVEFFLHKGLHFRNEAEQQEEEAPAPVPTTETKKTLSKKDLAKERRKEKKEAKEKEKREKKQKNKEAKEAKKRLKGAKKGSNISEEKKEESVVVNTPAPAPATTPAPAEGEKEGAEKEQPEEVKAEQKDEQKKQIAKRHLGNVTKEAQITFEFGMDKDYKPTAELKELPFQVQIRFTTLDGTKCIRSITRAQPITKDRNLAEQEADLQVLGLNIAQQSAKMAFKGEYTQARLNAYANKKLLKRAKKDDADEEYYSNWKSNLNKMERKLQTAQTKEKKAGLNLSDSSEGEDMEETNSRLSVKPKADKKKNMRSGARNDSTATFLYQMKSPNKKMVKSKKSN